MAALGLHAPAPHCHRSPGVVTRCKCPILIVWSVPLQTLQPVQSELHCVWNARMHCILKALMLYRSSLRQRFPATRNTE
eukprot:2129205-Rhodomonas_salina.1